MTALHVQQRIQNDRNTSALEQARHGQSIIKVKGRYDGAEA